MTNPTLDPEIISELRLKLDDIFEDAKSYGGPNIDETFDRVFDFVKSFLAKELANQKREDKIMYNSVIKAELERQSEKEYKRAKEWYQDRLEIKLIKQKEEIREEIKKMKVIAVWDSGKKMWKPNWVSLDDILNLEVLRD